MFYIEFNINFADDGFGNLVKIPFAKKLQIVNYSFPGFEDLI